MRKLTVLAMLAAVLLAGTALARTLTVRPNATFNPAVAGFGPTTTNNDDTCDIGNAALCGPAKRACGSHRSADGHHA